jgi:four helix bundle protein
MNILWKDLRTRDLADQLYRAACSISANIAEGYAHSTGKNRARYYEYALGSAREARDWYYKARHILCDEISFHRIKFLTSVIRLLTTMVPQQRTSGNIRDEKGVYQTSVDAQNSSDSICYVEIPLP